MRAILALLLPPFFLMPITSPALSDEWASRTGNCFEWEGYWTVDRDQSGVWIGFIDFQQVGGPCAPPTNSTVTYDVRAAIVGEDFFAHRVFGSTQCNLYGRVRGDQVRGFEICSGVSEPLAFALQLRKPN
jgi:hypothetical protein